MRRTFGICFLVLLSAFCLWKYALKRLSIRERYIIFARVVDMRGFAEIGTELGLGYQGVAAVYYRAIRKIKEFIVKSEKEGKASK